MLPFDAYREAASAVAAALAPVPRTAVVLGSGLGGLAGALEGARRVDYRGLPHFPAPTNAGHAGRLLAGTLRNVPVLLCSGRVHCYEGYTMEQAAFYVRALGLAGVKRIIFTNAAGAVNPDFAVGDFMLIRDHIKLCAESPCTGVPDGMLGPRFFDMTNAYTPALREAARAAAADIGLTLREGVYMYFAGPQYETAAEIRAAALLGADAVGMSTVPEVIAAAQMGLQVLGLSCLTNMAAGLSAAPLDDGDVRRQSELAGERFAALIARILERMGK